MVPFECQMRYKPLQGVASKTKPELRRAWVGSAKRVTPWFRVQPGLTGVEGCCMPPYKSPTTTIETVGSLLVSMQLVVRPLVHHVCSLLRRRDWPGVQKATPSERLEEMRFFKHFDASVHSKPTPLMENYPDVCVSPELCRCSRGLCRLPCVDF